MPQLLWTHLLSLLMLQPLSSSFCSSSMCMRISVLQLLHLALPLHYSVFPFFFAWPTSHLSCVSSNVILRAFFFFFTWMYNTYPLTSHTTLLCLALSEFSFFTDFLFDWMVVWVCTSLCVCLASKSGLQYDKDIVFFYSPTYLECLR